MMEDHDLIDLAQAANKPWHTWFRQSNQGQSSRIDLILTSMAVGDLRVNTTLHFLDHAFLEATFGQTRCKRTFAMKDFILGSDEFLIKSHEYIDNCLARHAHDPSLHMMDPDDHDLEQAQPQLSADHGKLFNNPDTGHTALHTFNNIISDLHDIHNDIARQTAKAQADRLRVPSIQLVRLKDKLRKARTEDDKTIIHDQICEIQKWIADDIEAKDQAAQMRISNFYKLATGKMVPESFTCIKDLKIF